MSNKLTLTYNYKVLNVDYNIILLKKSEKIWNCGFSKILHFAPGADPENFKGGGPIIFLQFTT